MGNGFKSRAAEPCFELKPAETWRTKPCSNLFKRCRRPFATSSLDNLDSGCSYVPNEHWISMPWDWFTDSWHPLKPKKWHQTKNLCPCLSNFWHRKWYQQTPGTNTSFMLFEHRIFTKNRIWSIICLQYFRAPKIFHFPAPCREQPTPLQATFWLSQLRASQSIYIYTYVYIYIFIYIYILYVFAVNPTVGGPTL